MQKQAYTPELDRSNTNNRRHLWLGGIICAVAALFYCYEFILRIIPGILEGELSAAFGHISATVFGQLAALYYFAYSPMQMPVGLLMDRFGPRRLLSLACLCCTLGSFLFTIFSSITIAGIGRLFVGFGSSFAFVGVLYLTTHWLPKRYFSLVVGLTTTLSMLGLVYGEVQVTHLVANLSLRSVLMGLVIIGGGLTLFIAALVRDGDKASAVKSDPWSKFIRDVVKVLLSPQVWLIGFVGACLYTSLSVFGELWGKTYLENAHHLSKFVAAKTMSALFLGWAVGAPLFGYLSDHTGRRKLPLLFGAVGALICISFILYFPSLPYAVLYVLLFLYGVFSGTEIIVFVMAKENSGASLSGTVFAATNLIVTLAGGIFQPMVGFLLDTVHRAQGLEGASQHLFIAADYQIALAILPISLILVIFCGFLLKDHKKILL